MKKYKIKTIQDILNCVTVDNIDNFLIDLRGLISTYLALQELSNHVAEEMKLPSELAKIESEGFTWIDDGKHDMNVKLKGK